MKESRHYSSHEEYHPKSKAPHASMIQISGTQTPEAGTSGGPVRRTCGQAWQRALNERINELCIYIELYCVLLYTQSALQSCGGFLLNHHQCAASTWMMRQLPQDNAASALTAHQLQVESRESHSANQVDDLANLQKPSFSASSSLHLPLSFPPPS